MEVLLKCLSFSEVAWKIVQQDWIYLKAYTVSPLTEGQKLVKKNSIFYTSVIRTVVTVKYHTCYDTSGAFYSLVLNSKLWERGPPV